MKEVDRFAHGQLQNFVDVQTVVVDFENARLVARSFAFLADQFDIGEELHLHRDRAVALADFAAAAGNVEREMSRPCSRACPLPCVEANASRIRSKP